MAKTDTLSQELELKAATGVSGPTVYDLLEEQKAAIDKALPNVGLTAEQLIRVLQTQIRLTPALGECTPQSLLGAVMFTAQLGLEPGPLGQAYLIPFNNNKTGKKEVQFIVGYKGLIALAYRGSGIHVKAYAIRKNDTFEFNYGDGTATHTYPMGIARGEIIGFWSRAVFPNGASSIHVMSKDEVDAHRKRSAARDSGPWVTDYEPMGCKTCIRVHAAQLPLASNAQRAITADETALAFDDVDGVIAATEQAPIMDVTALEEVEGETNE